jgi:hypothetical protein
MSNLSVGLSSTIKIRTRVFFEIGICYPLAKRQTPEYPGISSEYGAQPGIPCRRNSSGAQSLFPLVLSVAVLPPIGKPARIPAGQPKFDRCHKNQELAWR